MGSKIIQVNSLLSYSPKYRYTHLIERHINGFYRDIVGEVLVSSFNVTFTLTLGRTNSQSIVII